MRHPPTARGAGTARVSSNTYDHGPSAALLDKVRALDSLPRLGALKTLDLRGNDIRGGITYIAQVLKRNRTLKLLNLSENKIDVAGLVQLAEALKYNSSLETLDLSKNPCCGPGLEGIQSLRTAFTLNTSLKRLFLSATGLSSPGAIALAEFLPESASLLHLDLTQNNLDHAGVLAISEGLKSNFVMRLSREILSCCIRNTEEAEKSARAAGSDEPSGRGAAKGVWSMIEESQLARGVNSSSPGERAHAKVRLLLFSFALLARGADGRGVRCMQSESDMMAQARECKVQMEVVVSRVSSSPPSSSTSLTPAELQTTQRAKALLPALVTLIENTSDITLMEEMFELNDALSALVEALEAVSESGREEDMMMMNGAGAGHPLSRKSSASNVLGLEGGPPGDAHGGGEMNGTASGASIPDIRVEDQHSHYNTNVLTEEPSHMEPSADEEEDMSGSTSKLDKGKGKAPEQPSPVLEKLIMGGSFSITGSDDEDEDEERRRQAEEELMALGGHVPPELPLVSPTERYGAHDLVAMKRTEADVGLNLVRSRVWVEEEGEIFRKGQALLSEEQMESEYAGEELRQGLLVTELQRPPPRHLDPESDYFDENHLIRDHDAEAFTAALEAGGEGPKSPTSPGPVRPTYAVRQRSMSTESLQMQKGVKRTMSSESIQKAGQGQGQQS
ncbi:hypothetical protein M422DRAFT_247057 [Sphaerobolus stellatus SS14]|nr:hypothetical protein M422DRAFT_247057 [Sphaerobolus stellatus SS14]